MGPRERLHARTWPQMFATGAMLPGRNSEALCGVRLHKPHGVLLGLLLMMGVDLA